MTAETAEAVAAFEKEWEEYSSVERPRGALDVPAWVWRLADRKILYTEEVEYIDQDVSDEVKEEVIRLVELTSRILGIGYWTAIFLRPLVRKIHRRTGRPVRVLDVGTGHGDIILRTAKILGRLAGAPVVCAGLDYNPAYVELARENARRRGQEEVEFIVGNAFDLDLAPGSWDILITNWMIHHLTPSQVFQMVREFDRVSAEGMMLFDVARTWSAMPGALLVTAPMTHAERHDSLTTMRKGYRHTEMRFILDRAGVGGWVKRYRLMKVLPFPWINVFGGLKGA